jgi:hypothetical protein
MIKSYHYYKNKQNKLGMKEVFRRWLKNWRTFNGLTESDLNQKNIRESLL